MAQELIYTSAPRGLRVGASGFCTVACTRGMAPNYIEALESLSGYTAVFPPHHPQAALNPVSFSHHVLRIGGRQVSVLSRVAAAGVDHTGRSNKLAHHVVVSPEERPAGGPAWVIQQEGMLRTGWDEPAGYIDELKRVPRGDSVPAPCRAWQERLGDAGWAGVLAQSFVEDLRRPSFLLYEPGTDVLPLIGEAMRLLRPEQRWQVTFNTYFESLPIGATCLWRCCLPDSLALKQARRMRGALVLDLMAGTGQPEEAVRRLEGGSALIEYARSGVPPVVKEAPREPAPVVEEAALVSEVELDGVPLALESDGAPPPPDVGKARAVAMRRRRSEWRTQRAEQAEQRRRRRRVIRLIAVGVVLLLSFMLLAAFAVRGKLSQLSGLVASWRASGAEPGVEKQQTPPGHKTGSQRQEAVQNLHNHPPAAGVPEDPIPPPLPSEKNDKGVPSQPEPSTFAPEGGAEERPVEPKPSVHGAAAVPEQSPQQIPTVERVEFKPDFHFLIEVAPKKNKFEIKGITSEWCITGLRTIDDADAVKAVVDRVDRRVILHGQNPQGDSPAEKVLEFFTDQDALCFVKHAKDVTSIGDCLSDVSYVEISKPRGDEVVYVLTRKVEREALWKAIGPFSFAARCRLPKPARLELTKDALPEKVPIGNKEKAEYFARVEPTPEGLSFRLDSRELSEAQKELRETDAKLKAAREKLPTDFIAAREEHLMLKDNPEAKAERKQAAKKTYEEEKKGIVSKDFDALVAAELNHESAADWVERAEQEVKGALLRRAEAPVELPKDEPIVIVTLKGPESEKH